MTVDQGCLCASKTIWSAFNIEVVQAAADPNAQPSLPDTSSDVLALPSVRHFARQSGVEISLLAPGSGKNGRVERSDVERYLSQPKEAPASTQVASREDVVIELGRTRYGMWKAMAKVCVPQ